MDNMEHKHENKIIDGTIENIEMLLQHFGEVKYTPYKHTLDFKFQITKTYAQKYICDFIINTMTNENNDYNIILFDTCIKQFTYSDDSILNIINLIYKSLISCTNTIREELIQQYMDDNKFTINTFIEMRTLYYDKTRKLGYHLYCLNNSIHIKNNSMFKIIRDYVYYTEILNRQFTYNGKEMYIFAILISLIEKNNKQDILNVFKIINTYNGFSYSVAIKSKRNVIFNELLDHQGQHNIICDETLTTFVQNIDKNIKRVLHDTLTKKEIKTTIDTILDDIYMCNKIANVDMFLKLYHQYLQKRLICNKYTQPIIESKVLETLNVHNNLNSYIMMEYCINDIKSIEFVNKEFRNIVLAFDSGLYSQTLQNLYDRNISNFIILRDNAWSFINNHQRIYEPDLIKMHLDIFIKYYTHYFTDRFNKYASRKIEYNYDISTVDIELCINDSKYNLHMNLLQASILGHIYDNHTISALELAETMNVQLKDINIEINSLLYSGIITRNAKYRKDDIAIKFYINPDFKSEQTDINIFELIDTLKHIQENS